MASIPAGILGLALEHQLRTITAKPELAAIFLMVNGCLLLGAERFRRRAEVRELAVPRGRQGGRWRELRHARVPRGAGHRRRPVDRAGRRHQPRRRDDGAGLARGLDHSDSARFAFLLATPIILAAGLFKLPDLLGHIGDGIRGQALVACATAAVTAHLHRRVPGALVQDQTLIPFAVYCLVFGVAMVIYTQT